jgi:lactoylglutathione lyase
VRIEHVAIWTKDIERMKEFYVRYFAATAGARYFNPAKNFQSYFLSFDDGCRLELMQKPEIPETKNDPQHQFKGIIHLAITVGNEEKVNALTEELRKNGYAIVGEPRTTGDEYYESVILDPEGNRIEICA